MGVGMRVAACAFVVTLLGIGACCAEDQLEGDTLRKAVAGKTVHLETPLGSLPINYKNNGTMQASTIQLAAYTGSTRDRGTWWIVADKLCQRWNNWLGGKPFCFTLRQHGESVQWTRDDGLSGVAVIKR
jgi:hypothetical protein